MRGKTGLQSREILVTVQTGLCIYCKVREKTYSFQVKIHLQSKFCMDFYSLLFTLFFFPGQKNSDNCANKNNRRGSDKQPFK